MILRVQRRVAWEESVAEPQSEGTCPYVGGVSWTETPCTPQNLPQKINPPIAFAWGVLGSAIGGVPFLLTHPVVFRSS
jgi:hypothetical protein